MGRKPLIRVVVGEAAGPSATLGSILESEGFLVVGRASDAGELRGLVARARPDVIVFDAETNAVTVLSARAWAPEAGIVVVWPFGVATTAADQQVDPARVREDLGGAVRRAVSAPRAGAAAAVPDVAAGVTAVTGGRAHASGEVERRRRDVVPLLAAACIAALLIASVAVGLRSGRPSIVAQGPIGGSLGPGGSDNGHERGPGLEPRPRIPPPIDLSPSSDPRRTAGRGSVTVRGGNGARGPVGGSGGNGPIGTGPGGDGGSPTPVGPGNSSGHGRSDEAHGNGNAFGHAKHHGGKGRGHGGEKGHGHGNADGDHGHGNDAEHGSRHGHDG